MSLIERARNGWNVFRSRDQSLKEPEIVGSSIMYDQGPTRTRRFISSEKSILASIHNRVGIDVSELDIFHVRLDEQNRFLEPIESGLQNCLTVEANIDQAATAFRRDLTMSLLETGVIAVVPVTTSNNPLETGSYDIYTMRVGTVVDWYPQHVRVRLYNEDVGMSQEILLPKADVAIIENPLYAVMNEPNSTYQRLIRKLNLLDVIDEQSSSGKLDIIVQLPYTIRNEVRRADASRRMKDIELQMRNSKYGIAYMDGSERITQLNRPSENNMLKQVEYLTSMLYGQLGITTEILDGTASEEAMVNYFSRTVKPIVNAIAEEFERKFLTKTARTQKQAIRFFQNPFELVPITKLAAMAETFTRNEILSSNDIRRNIGMAPSSDPRADLLVNKNMPQIKEEGESSETKEIESTTIETTSADDFIKGYSSKKRV